MYKFILLLRFINVNSYNFKSRCTNGQYDDEAREGNGKLLCPNEAFTEISAGYEADISRYQLCKFRRYVRPASGLKIWSLICFRLMDLSETVLCQEN